MKTKYFFLAAFAAMLASCANEEYIGDTSPNATLEQTGDGSIQFGFDFQNATRAGGDIAGPAAATILGGNFYVTGTKGTEADTYPTGNIVFDNYFVHYSVNTAGTTESNTANWEYVGVTPGTGSYANWEKLGDYSAQTIKYWDFSTAQYDFFAFSTGSYKAKKDKATPASDEIGVTKAAYGSSLESSGVAYTFYLPSVAALQSTYITDITEVMKTNYRKEVTLKFKNLGSKVRMALYETVPGYSVKDVEFYSVDGTTDLSGAKSVDGSSNPSAALISTGLPSKGSIAVYFPNVGNLNAPNTQAYNKAAATVVPGAALITYQQFGNLYNFQDKEDGEASGDYLGRNLNEATFAGQVNDNYYQLVFPVSSSAPLTLRVDYTLVSTDGSGEEINVKGAKAVVPSTFTKWLPNYAYTYIFKISDNTNGWTGTSGDPAGLFPITFDAVVAEFTEVSGEQTTITTVATPSITTYQQGHDYSATNEYSKSGNKLYVQVMNNASVPASLVADLNDDTEEGTDRSLLFLVSDDDATEAEVMDALEKRTTAIGAANVTGRNGITLTKSSDIVNNVTSIVNGVDNNAILVSAGTAAEINIANLTENKTYAYVYDYTTEGDDKIVTTIYQPIEKSVGATIPSGVKYVTKATLDGITYDSNKTTAGEAVSANYLYFSRNSTDGGTTWTYSYVSVDGKATLPAGLLKVDISTKLSTGDGSVTVAAGTVCFETYLRNNGKYAVKVIKIVA